MRQEAKELEQGPLLMWWECDHEGKGLTGCPVCDERLEADARLRLKQARAKIFRCQDAIRSLLKDIKEEEKSLVEIKKEAEPVTHQIYGDYYGML